MTKHNNAGMQNNLEPSQSLTQNNCSALYNEPIISINYNTMINMNKARTKVKNKTYYFVLVFTIIHQFTLAGYHKI